MKSVNIHDAKTSFSKLVEEAENGQEIVIAKASKPQAKLVPFEKKRVKRRKYLLKGKINIAKNFDEPFPEELQNNSINSNLTTLTNLMKIH